MIKTALNNQETFSGLSEQLSHIKRAESTKESKQSTHSLTFKDVVYNSSVPLNPLYSHSVKVKDGGMK